MDSDRYYGRIESMLKGIALRLKLLLALEYLLRLALLFFVILLGSLFVWKTEDIFPYLPFIYYLSALIVLLLVFILGLKTIFSRISMQRVARGLEEKFPRLKDNVINAFLLFHQTKNVSESDSTSRELITAHMRKTAHEISDIRPEQVVSFKRVFPQVKLLLPVFIAFIAVLGMEPQYLNRSLAYLLHPLSALPERETFILVEQPPGIVLRGSPVTISARSTGHVSDPLSLRILPEKGEVIRISMTSEAEHRYLHRIPSVQDSFRYQAFSGSAESPIYFLRVVDAPDIGKIRLTLIAPGYSERSQQVIDDGHIEALKGTVVHLKAWATKAILEGKLILNQKEKLLLAVQGDRLDGNLLVLYPGTYSISVRDELGFENINPAQYRIRLVPDKYPEGEFITPTEDLEVSGKEVLPLVYAARDDFGITTIRLIYQMRGTERTITLKTLKKHRSAGPEGFNWDLASLALIPGDRVTYRLEVWDNDTVSGPKVGYSEPLILNVKNERERAARDVAHIQEIANALLDLLADQLEVVKDAAGLSLDMSEILKKVDTLLRRMGAEKIERFDLESLKKNLTTLKKRIAQLPRETITQEMERLAILAEQLVKKTRMHEVEALAREIQNRQKQIIETFRDQKGPLTSEQLQAMLQEIEKLKDLISQVMEALSRTAAQLPDEFINSPELDGMEFKDLFQDLEEIQKKLMAGDMAGAVEAAKRLLQTLSNMMAAMASAGAQAGTGAMNRLQSEMSRKAGELEKIVLEQKEILIGTENVHREIKDAMEAETEKRLHEMVPRLKEILKQLHDRLPAEGKDSALALERLLEERQMERFSQLGKRLKDELAEAPDMDTLLNRLMKMAEAIVPGEQESMAEDMRRQFPGLSSREKALMERTGELGNKLEVLSQLFPGMDTEIINDIKDAAGSMDTASGKLGGEDASGAIPPEQEAIRRLTRSQQAMQQMARQMARQMQANQWGNPWRHDPRGGWYYGPWGPMPTLPQPEVKRPPERGYTGIDREEFDPPAKEDYRAPQILREKIMEALKEDVPSQYRKEVEKYFRGLTQ